MKVFFKALVLSVMFLSFFLTSVADAYVNVDGYYRSNGTYVAPHVRSNPNGLKYDNYSYTPSQGLYNSTYGTRDNTWDTPTYITDPDYYIGKSIYDNNGSNPTSYSAPPPASQTTCPTNSQISLTDPTKCTCNTGFKTNLSKDGCVKKSCGANQYLSEINGECYCKDNFLIDNGKCITHTQDCVNDFGQNVYGVQGTNQLNSNCYCKEGYKWNNNNTSCIKIEEVEKINESIKKEEPIKRVLAENEKQKNQETLILKEESSLKTPDFSAPENTDNVTTTNSNTLVITQPEDGGGTTTSKSLAATHNISEDKQKTPKGDLMTFAVLLTAIGAGWLLFKSLK